VIGPNAILQFLPVIEQSFGMERAIEILSNAGVPAVPHDTGMIPEEDAARFHRQVRIVEPVLAPTLAIEAGKRTGDYILEHRIPGPAKLLLRLLPPKPAAVILSRAISRHAWTFAGSGRFKACSPWRFEIEKNPMVRGEESSDCLCNWHAAVFERLYRVLVGSDCRCKEIDCGARGPGHKCRFVLLRS